LSILTAEEGMTKEAEENRKNAVAHTVMGLCNIHQAAVYNLLEKLNTSESVRNFSVEETARKERKKQLASAGFTAVATFIGTALAYGWMQHRNK